MNLADLAETNIKLYGEYPFLTYEGKAYSNTDLRRLACRLGNGLRSLGVGPGGKVVVLMPNSPDVIVAFQAAFRLGATVIPVMFMLGPQEINYILAHSEAETVVTHSQFYDKVKQAAQGVASVKRIVLADKSVDGAPSFSTLIDGQSDDLPIAPTGAHDVAVMLYTSGTTGRPKGVMLTHLNLYSNAKLAAVTTEFERTDFSDKPTIALLALPLAHSYGLTVMNVGFLVGGRYVLMTWFEPEAAMRLIQQHKVTSFSGVPTMYAYMLNHPKVDQFDLSSVTSWGSGSAPLPVEIQRKFDAKIGKEIFDGYGLSENSPVVAASRPTMPNKRGSIGVPIYGIDISIVDYDDKPVQRGEIGELLVRGPSVMKGYYKNPELTAHVLRNGWLHTGDMMRMDEDGYLWVVERKDDMIIRGGENIYPREVEEVLYRHPKVAEASVIGVPDAEMGQEVQGYVVLRPNEQATEAELVEFCHGHIAKFKSPKHVAVVAALPKNLIGKTLRKELRRMYQEAQAAR
ncbi:MAG: long-chain-fatty-acid--CoA ligase [Chloroflexi bacterium]|nr:long-chain-fatty-acid--CoA ligase [Chloroflexota bacterium]